MGSEALAVTHIPTNLIHPLTLPLTVIKTSTLLKLHKQSYRNMHEWGMVWLPLMRSFHHKASCKLLNFFSHSLISSVRCIVRTPGTIRHVQRINTTC